MAYVQVVERGNQKAVTYSVESRLFQDNIVLIDGEIDEDTVVDIQNQLSYLQSKLDPNSSNEDDKKITIRINSPGGSVYAGLGIYDMMMYLQKHGYIIETINMHMAASMAAILLMAGSKGYRRTMPHARTMVHEISSWNYGKIEDMRDAFEETQKLQEDINEIIKNHASEELIDKCKRKDFYMKGKEAIDYGIVDSVIE